MLTLRGTGLAGLGDSYGNTGPVEGTSLPSSELLWQDWLSPAAAAPSPPLAPRPAGRKVVRANAPSSPSEISDEDYGPALPPPLKGGTLFGFIPLPSWLPAWAAYGLLGAGALAVGYKVYKGMGKGGRRRSTNPKDKGARKARVVEGRDDEDGELLERARKFRKDFHWGIAGRKVVRRKVNEPPRVGTQLGELTAVVYRTKKRGEEANFFHHDFEGRKPKLVMDIENKKLHIVGGDYDVTADGITG